MQPKFICGECRYFGFRGMDWWCRHPAHAGPVKRASECPDFLDMYAKVLPGRQDPHPAPVDIYGRELRP